LKNPKNSKLINVRLAVTVHLWNPHFHQQLVENAAITFTSRHTMLLHISLANETVTALQKVGSIISVNINTKEKTLSQFLADDIMQLNI